MFDYNDELQILKINSSYLIYKWRNDDGHIFTDLDVSCRKEAVFDGPEFPAKGLKVKVYWPLLSGWYSATVKR